MSLLNRKFKKNFQHVAFSENRGGGDGAGDGAGRGGEGDVKV